MESNTHKGIQGHGLIIGGSYGKIGAAVLSSKACLKSGSGLVTAFVPKCGYEILQISNPEVMVIPDKNEQYISEIEMNFEPNAVGIGMGLGQEETTQKAFLKLILQNKSPMVVDADGLNILSLHQKEVKFASQQLILTPHQKELQRLIGTWNSLDEKLEKVKTLSKKYNAIIVVKGAPTEIVYQDLVYVNTTGNQGLATAGSGDVLSGILTGLLAQGYSPLDAALIGVFVHGKSADIGVLETGYQAFIASDIIRFLGKAFIELDANT